MATKQSSCQMSRSESPLHQAPSRKPFRRLAAVRLARDLPVSQSARDAGEIAVSRAKFLNFRIHQPVREMPRSTESRRDYLIYVKVGIIWLAILSGGMSTSFPAIGIPALTDSGIELTPAQVSLVGSVRQAGIIVGALITGPLLDNWGRRKGILSSIIPGIAGYIVICSSSSVTALSLGLLLEGVSMGMMNTAGAVYLAEALSKEWRGAVTVARNVFMSIGLTITYILGLFMKGKIQLISLVAFVVPTLAFLLGLCFLEETKIWAQQSKTVEKKKSFVALYTDFWKALTSRPDVYKPFGILNFVNFLRHTSGVGVITNYTINIIADTGTASDPYIVAIILGIIRTGAAIMSVVLCSFFGRRTIMFFSGILMTVSMIGLALLQYMDGWPKLTPEAFLAVFISTSVVFLSISMSLQGEIFPTEFRGMCSSSTMTLSNAQAVIVLASYPLLKAWIGFEYVMAIFAAASASCVLFTFFMVPDTDNKTLDEIGRMFRKNSGLAVASDEMLPIQGVSPAGNDIVIMRRKSSKSLGMSEPAAVELLPKQ